MSYNILEDSSSNLIECLAFIQNNYPYYIKDKLEDSYSNLKYSVQMLQKSLNGIININELYKIIIFDILIGNSDRHHSNIAIIAKGTIYKTQEEMLDISFNYKLSPLYDNGSSLCSYEDNNNLEIFFKDKMEFEALVNTKSKSAIGWENQRPIRHLELLQKIKYNINEQNICKILNEFDNEIISEDMKKLIRVYILERKKRMLEIYNLKEEV